MTRLEFIAGQRALLAAAIGAFARPGDGYALVDFPDHANVGDSAIWLGASAVLEELTGRPPVHVAEGRRMGLAGLAGRLGDGTIYINGGGNFGDLWPASQDFREALLDLFPRTRIVQLPQSIHFEDEANAERCAAAIARHGDFHLLVRDATSAAYARERFDCPVTLVPDCAFGLGPLARSAEPSRAVYALLRSDKEASGAEHGALRALAPVVEDWLAEPGPEVGWLRLRILVDTLLSPRFAGTAARPGWYRRMAKLRLARGAAALCSGRQAVTDRLHGHILCVLLGIPHVALDNSYGKVGAYYRQWTRAVEGAAFATNAAAAVQALAWHSELASAAASER